MKQIIKFIIIFTAMILPYESIAVQKDTTSPLTEFILENYVIKSLDPAELTAKIKQPAITIDTNGIRFTIEEVLFDGHTLYACYSTVPIDEGIMLMADIGSPENCIIPNSELNPDGFDITFAQKAADNNKKLRMISLAFLNSDATSGLYIYDYHADGSMTICGAQNFANSRNMRNFELRVKTHDADINELHGDNIEFTLDCALTWDSTVLHKEDGLLGLDVEVEYCTGPLQTWLQVAVTADSYISDDIQQCFTDSVLKIYSSNDRKEIPTLSGGGQFLDSTGDNTDSLNHGGRAIYFFELPHDFIMPEQLRLELFQIFSNNEIAAECIIDASAE